MALEDQREELSYQMRLKEVGTKCRRGGFYMNLLCLFSSVKSPTGFGRVWWHGVWHNHTEITQITADSRTENCDYRPYTTLCANARNARISYKPQLRLDAPPLPSTPLFSSPSSLLLDISITPLLVSLSFFSPSLPFFSVFLSPFHSLPLSSSAQE